MHAETYAAQGNGCTPSGPVTSPGFAVPLRWSTGGNWGRAGGTSTATTRPGAYTATFPCSDGRVATATFTVTGTPPSSVTPPPSSRPATPQRPAPDRDRPQVTVRPVGAPQTGGGGLGVSFTK
ncbi:hypothetical protein AB0F91_08840 [Amycolatopsis sp. NPDC023774]|uniref:hypothetical protein n=1 Tax=Amycolatopsis sp. NPDC023774 TaxID=3155015 RepID=UPI0033F8A94E